MSSGEGRVGGDEAIVRPVIDAVAREEHGHRVVGLRAGENAERVYDVRRGGRAVALAFVHQHAPHHLLMQRAKPLLHRIGEGDGVVARVGQVAVRLVLAQAGDARIFRDADGEKIQRAALIESALGSVGEA